MIVGAVNSETNLVKKYYILYYLKKTFLYLISAAGGGAGVGGATAGPGAGSWRALQPMEVPRYQHGVALLGGFLFIVGGQSTYDTKGKTAVDSAYRYDPRFDRWLQIAALNEKRTFFHLSALNGKLYAVGGRNATGEIGECAMALL